MAVTVTIAGLRQELWRKKLFADVRDELWITKFIGTSPRSMIMEMTDLKKQKGAKINYGLGAKLSGAGVTGDSTLEGSEEAMNTYEEELEINQLRHAVRMTGRMDEKKAAYNMRSNAKEKLTDWWAERLDQELIDKMCGKTTSTFANTPTAAASAMSVFAGGAANLAATTSAMKMDTKVLDKAKQVAKLATTKVRPLRINGKPHYVAILHTYDLTNLQQDPVWNQAQREANVRGEKNPIFSGAAGMWNSIIVHEHEYIFRSNDGNGAAYVARNILCGQQAGVIGWGAPVRWVEKSFDYGNSWGISVGAIFGCIKPIFNSLDYGVVTMWCGSAAASTA